MILPFKEPSATLYYQLMGVVVNAGQRFASIADMQVGDGNQQAAVGTTVALLRDVEVTDNVCNSQKNYMLALKNEFRIIISCI